MLQRIWNVKIRHQANLIKKQLLKHQKLTKQLLTIQNLMRSITRSVDRKYRRTPQACIVIRLNVQVTSIKCSLILTKITSLPTRKFKNRTIFIREEWFLKVEEWLKLERECWLMKVKWCRLSRWYVRHLDRILKDKIRHSRWGRQQE
jgi:hypothetical protein